MAETLETRQAHQSSLEEIHKTLVAASNKMAQLQLGAIDDTATSEAVADTMSQLSPIIEAIDALAQSYQMETNRLSNEGGLS